MYNRNKGIMLLFLKNGFFGILLVFYNFFFILFYILIVLVGIFIIICGIFVGIYFYKYCNVYFYLIKNIKVD